MESTLASANTPYDSDTGLGMIVMCLLILGAVCVLAAVPVATARRRGLRQNEGLVALMILWAITSAGSAIYYTNAVMTWNRTYTQNIMTGLLDPSDKSDRPKKPWAMWGGLIVVYGSATAWSILRSTGESQRGNTQDRKDGDRS